MAWTNKQKCAWQRQDYAKHPEKWRNKMLLAKYAISLEQYNKMLEAQNGKCAICRSYESRILKNSTKPDSLSVDHDHESGANRGLLCHNCNTGLGKFKDNPELLQVASEYLNKHRLSKS